MNDEVQQPAQPATTPPLEVRNLCAIFTLAHLRAGIQPLQMRREPDGPLEMFAPPLLQWRYREKVRINGAVAFQWSDWHNVGLALEAPPPAA